MAPAAGTNSRPTSAPSSQTAWTKSSPLAKEGYDPEYGARPLKRAIQKRILNPIADAILAGQLSPGQVAHIDWTGEAFQIEAHDPAHSEKENHEGAVA